MLFSHYKGTCQVRKSYQTVIAVKRLLHYYYVIRNAVIDAIISLKRNNDPEEQKSFQRAVVHILRINSSHFENNSKFCNELAKQAFSENSLNSLISIFGIFFFCYC